MLGYIENNNYTLIHQDNGTVRIESGYFTGIKKVIHTSEVSLSLEEVKELIAYLQNFVGEHENKEESDDTVHM